MIKTIASLPLLLALCGCKQPPEGEHFMTEASAERGLAMIERAGCAACHDIPGIDWPKGRVGPSLDGFGAQALIGGRAPNQPDVLARFVRNAPAVVPGTAMPPMPLTPEEARDVAAYLHTLQP